jgi:hypothetical protein
LYHISESLETIFWVKILQFCDADADPGIFLTLDPGSGMGKIRIRDKHPGSATLPASKKFWRPHQVKGRVSQDFKASKFTKSERKKSTGRNGKACIRKEG